MADGQMIFLTLHAPKVAFDLYLRGQPCHKSGSNKDLFFILCKSFRFLNFRFFQTSQFLFNKLNLYFKFLNLSLHFKFYILYF